MSRTHQHIIAVLSLFCFLHLQTRSWDSLDPLQDFVTRSSHGFRHELTSRSLAFYIAIKLKDFASAPDPNYT